MFSLRLPPSVCPCNFSSRLLWSPFFCDLFIFFSCRCNIFFSITTIYFLQPTLFLLQSTHWAKTPYRRTATCIRIVASFDGVCAFICIDSSSVISISMFVCMHVCAPVQRSYRFVCSVARRPWRDFCYLPLATHPLNVQPALHLVAQHISIYMHGKISLVSNLQPLFVTASTSALRILL